MSTTDPLFLDPGHGDVDRAARSLEDALKVSRRLSSDVLVLYAEKITDDLRDVAGDFEANRWQDWRDLEADEITPANTALFDDAPLVWLLDSKSGGPTEQRRRARGVFELVVERLGWSAILTHDFDVLVATYDPERGVREFPPGTPSDGTGRHIWG